MADLASVQSARAFTITEQTSAEQAHAWWRYNEYLSNIGLIEDTFLDSLSVGQGTGYWDVLPKLYEMEDSVQNNLTDSHLKSSKPLRIMYL